jgi:class 3 adenylate cyclase
MKSSNLKLYILAIAVIAVNFAASIGVQQGFWSWDYALYFYWAECALVGMLTLILYAKHLLIFFVILTAIGYLMGLKSYFLPGTVNILIGFWGLYSLCWLCYFEIRKTNFGQKLRLMHPFYQLVFYLMFMTGAIASSLAMTGYIFFGKVFIPVLPPHIMKQFISMMAIIPTLTIGILKIVDMVGARHFIHFLLGTYHQPVEIRRIVMFLDMVGSSGIAEKLPARKSMELIARFIFDASTAFRSHGGDILNYTGDGLVVLWPIDQADRALNAVNALENRLEMNRVSYEKSFGALPGFRIGLHAGPVVISQIGEEKLFLGLYGDVVNTASRIEQMNKKMGTKILFSRAFKQRVSIRMQERIVAIGKTEIAGREEDMEVFTLKKTASR